MHTDCKGPNNGRLQKIIVHESFCWCRHGRCCYRRCCRRMGSALCAADPLEERLRAALPGALLCVACPLHQAQMMPAHNAFGHSHSAMQQPEMQTACLCAATKEPPKCRRSLSLQPRSRRGVLTCIMVPLACTLCSAACMCCFVSGVSCALQGRPWCIWQPHHTCSSESR